MQAQPQVANVLTPSGQIQQIQIASLGNVQVSYLYIFLKCNVYVIILKKIMYF